MAFNIYIMKILKILFLCLISISVFSQESFPNNGVKSTFSTIYAFTNAHLIISSEKEIINGTLLIQDDKIINADSIVDIPEGAIIKDVKGVGTHIFTEKDIVRAKILQEVVVRYDKWKIQNNIK